MTVPHLIAILAAYLWGSFPTGYIIVWLKLKKDIRSFGSGNMGATNVGRALGKGWAIVAFLGDALKGFWPLVFVMEQLHWTSTPVLTLMAIASVLGHIYCPWLGFRGGKGVAVAEGVLLALSPFAAITGLGVYLAVASLTKISAIGSLSALVATLAYVALVDARWLPYVVAVGALIIWRHRENIRSLLAKRSRA